MIYEKSVDFHLKSQSAIQTEKENPQVISRDCFDIYNCPYWCIQGHSLNFWLSSQCNTLQKSNSGSNDLQNWPLWKGYKHKKLLVSVKWQNTALESGQQWCYYAQFLFKLWKNHQYGPLVGVYILHSAFPFSSGWDQREGWMIYGEMFSHLHWVTVSRDASRQDSRYTVYHVNSPGSRLISTKKNL